MARTTCGEERSYQSCESRMRSLRPESSGALAISMMSIKNLPSLQACVYNGWDCSALRETELISFGGHEVERFRRDELARCLAGKDTGHVHSEIQFADMRAFGEVELLKVHPENVG